MTGFDDIEHASLTHVGVRRSHNQDNHSVLLASDEQQWQTRGHVFLVADGMGAHAVGELASELAVGIIPHTFDKYAAQGTASALRKAFIEANASIHARGQQNREFEGMGTTATALVLRPDGAWVGHVGDSRAYRVRGGSIEQLSFDHSMVWEYARRQKIDPEEVQGIPSNVIFRSLGPEPLVPVDIEGVHPLRDGDIFVLCSDGLSGQLTDSEIGAVVTAMPPEEACQFLIDLANLRGGPDNITVLVIRVGRHLATPPPAHVPLSHRFPWPLLALLAGALLAGGAVALIMNHMNELATVAFVLAVAVILAGIVGLFVHHNREQRRASLAADRPEPKIHRAQKCVIDRALIDKLTRALAILQDQAKEKDSPIDWEAYAVMRESGGSHLGRGDLPAAFRDYCKAMQILMPAAPGRAEVFQPVWDRGDSPRSGPAVNGREAPAFRCERCGKTSPPPPGGVTPVCCERPMKKI